jgi:thiol peroxidase
MTKTEIKGEFTVKGNPVTVSGERVKAGDNAREFVVVDSNLNPVSLSKFKGKIKLIASVPSLDTPVCDLQIKRFNKEASSMSREVVIMFISMDLPFAQKRFCQSFDIKHVKTFSDHRDADFGKKYGVFIDELRLLARAVFLIDKEGKVRYVEYIKELSNQPDYDKALEALKSILR